MDKCVYTKDRANLQLKITAAKENVRKRLGEMKSLKKYRENNENTMKAVINVKTFSEAMERRVACWPREMRVYTAVGNMFLINDVSTLHKIFKLDVEYRMGQIETEKLMAALIESNLERFDNQLMIGFRILANYQKQINILDEIHKVLGG